MRTRPAIVLMALVLSACSLGGSPSPNPTPTSSSSQTPTSAPSSTASPSPIAACRLPVAGGDAPIDGNPAHGSAGHGGFVQFPTATFSADPASQGTYDRARSRWLPVSRAAVSPDGEHYAYTANQPATGPVAGSIHVVDVATGTERSIPVPAPSNVLSWESEGIYVVRVIPSSGAPPQGLVLVNPTASTFRQVSADGIWTQIVGGKAWGADLDAGIAPPAGGGPGAANRVRQLDLATGAASTFASYPGENVSVLGGGGPVPLLAHTTATTYSVVATGGALFSGAIVNSNPTVPLVVDGTVTWFSSFSGAVWRSDSGGPIHQVATTPLTASMVAGACR